MQRSLCTPVSCWNMICRHTTALNLVHSYTVGDSHARCHLLIRTIHNHMAVATAGGAPWDWEHGLCPRNHFLCKLQVKRGKKLTGHTKNVFPWYLLYHLLPPSGLANVLECFVNVSCGYKYFLARSQVKWKNISFWKIYLNSTSVDVENSQIVSIFLSIWIHDFLTYTSKKTTKL